MNTIFKYAISTSGVTLQLPRDAKPLTVQNQHGEPQMWVLLDPGAPLVNRRFAMFGTGHDVPNNANYIGTVQFSGGQLIFHLFEIL